MQLSGPQLTETDDGFTLNDAGSVTVVLYADRKADGGSTYRVYSNPIEVTFVLEAEESSEIVDTIASPETDEEVKQNESPADREVSGIGMVVIVLCSLLAVGVIGAVVLIVFKRRR